jgi:hypothetical protein
MQRKPLFLIIPVVAVIAALVLFLQRDNTGQPQSTASSRSQSLTGSGANMPPNSSLNPTPSGTPAPADPNSTPASATPRSPSGEAARPTERR